jgi:hypothetical protein
MLDQTMIFNSISYRKVMVIRALQHKKFAANLQPSTLVLTCIMIGTLFSFSIGLDKMFLTEFDVYAQKEQQTQQNEVKDSLSNQVTIKLDSVKFTQNDDSGDNQLKVGIIYETNDPKLVNTIMAGVMKVYTTDGTLIKTSSIPSGYILGQTGPMQFATTIEDKTIQHVKADIAMTDKSKLIKISNTLPVDATLEA